MKWMPNTLLRRRASRKPNRLRGPTADTSMNARCHRAPLLRRLRVAAIGALLIVCWFATISWTWTRTKCDDCGYSVDSTAYRIIGIPLLAGEIQHATDVQLLAADLGAPCPHINQSERFLQRWWGLAICKCPCTNGISGVAREGWYAENLARAARRRGSADPRIAQEFYDRVIVGHDRRYLMRVRSELEEQRDGRQSNGRVKRGAAKRGNKRGEQRGRNDLIKSF